MPKFPDGSTVIHRFFGIGTVVQGVGSSFLLVEFVGIQHTVSLAEIKLVSDEVVMHV